MSEERMARMIRRRIVFTPGADQKMRLSPDAGQDTRIEPIPGGAVSAAYQQVVRTLLSYYRDLTKEGKDREILSQVAFCGGDTLLWEGLGGFLASIRLENSRIIPQLILLPEAKTAEEVFPILSAEERRPFPVQVKYQGEKRYVRVFERESESAPAAQTPSGLWKDGGIYLITGGAGGLGLLFARHIAETAKNATLLLVGRQDRDEGDLCRQAGIDPARAHVRYFRCDIGSRDEVKRLAREIRESFSALTGVIHSAGLTRDSLFLKKSPEDADRVMRPKIEGLYNLDQEFGDIPVGFWLLMSSSAGVRGNVGQTDYAAANGFLDAYARMRNESGGNGRMISVNWPLWKDGGMQVDGRTLSLIFESTGLVPLETGTAFALLDRAAAEQLPQFIPVQGDQERIAGWMDVKTAPDEKEEKPQPVQAEKAAPEGRQEESGRDVRTALENYLKKVLSEQIQLPEDRIDPRMPMEEYGLTSIMTLELTDRLEKDFGPLSRTLFFEIETLRDLAKYLMDACPDKAKALMQGGGEKKESTLFQPVAEKAAPVQDKETITAAPEDHGWGIAIIGLAGSYPGAEDVETLWENIRDGKNCITPIPEDRWDHTRYYDADKTRTDRTYAKWGGFLENAECFDPLFFNISPAEAQIIDPQERLFLQCVYHAMEDAGYTRWDLSREERNGLRSLIGVFVGVMYEEYQLYGAQAQARGDMYTLNGSEASIANRVSYTLGFHGPSMSVDSMCSSSLSALHLACRSILEGACGMAVAGGVNLSLHPNKFLMLGQSRFLSAKGRCAAFGKDGDGYVPGEGVGAVILKPLEKAIRDGDHIYGVIRGSAINHSGKTSGYTVPNPKAQTGVILDAWRASKINPRAVSYIEAHGTGTELGDPIEINGLTRAFDTVTRDRQFAHIGSVKANIGHCESAAGIAGLTKILLQMEHGQIAPSIHSEPQNPNIRFEETPCRVPHSLIPWDRPALPEEGGVHTYPRLAGLSAFGAGGTNAHVVVEEAPDREAASMAPRLLLFVLSARTEKQLAQKAKDLCAWLEKNREAVQKNEIRLCDVAYTLLAGREPMECRLAIEADTLGQLTEALRRFAAGDKAGLRTNKLDKRGLLQGIPDAEDDLSAQVAAWLEKGDYSALAGQWLRGLAADYLKVFAGKGYRRISLPLYPFKKDRLWKPDRDQAMVPGGTERIHPLLHRNISDFREIKYESVFSAGEAFFADHRVNGMRTMPGVVYLEMARAAYLDALHEKDVPVSLSEILWIAPVCVGEGEEKKVLVILKPEESGAASFTVATDENGSRTVCCTGRIEKMNQDAPGRVDPAEMERAGTGRTEGADVYRCFDEMYLSYGKTQRSIQSVCRVGSGVFVHLRLPRESQGKMNAYRLWPAMMDGALQGAIALAEDSPLYTGKRGGAASVPFMLSSLQVYSGCTEDMWALVTPEDGRPDRLNIALCDQDGRVCVRFGQMWYRKTENAASRYCVMLEPVTEKLESGRFDPSFGTADKAIYLAGVGDGLARQIENSGLWNACHTLYPAGHHPTLSEYESIFESLYVSVREAVKAGNKHTLLQVLIGDEDEGLMECVSGLFMTAALEMPFFRGQCLVLRQGEEVTAEQLAEAGGCACALVYPGREPRTVTWKETERKIKADPPALWTDGGVYCITGGFGGLGRIFARDIAERAKGAKLLLLSRSPLDDEKKEWMAGLESRGAVCRFYQADVTKEDSVRDTMEQIRREFGHLNGLLHCAGITKDHFLMMKEPEEWRRVTAPKVAGTWYLDQYSRDLKPDWMILFSSFTAVTGNLGQADYALGNAFMDHFALRRNRMAAAGERTGKTISVNWPFFRDGGIALDEAFLRAMWEKSGLTPLDGATGLRALAAACDAGMERVAPVTGDPVRIRAMFRQSAPAQAAEAAKPESVAEKAAPTAQESRQADKQAFLLDVFSGILLLDKEDFTADTLFEDLGIDSILAMKITDRLEKDFGPLPKTLLFECQSISALATRLPDLSAPAENTPEKARKTETAETAKASAAEKPAEDGIVIIGMAGSYAKSKDLRALWKNLKAGTDCITEIPPERWDYHDYEDVCYAKWGGFLDGVDQFDPMFFHITPNFADIMDPQERLFLETAYHAVEDAGYTKKTLGYQPGGEIRRNVGVFVGIMNEQYQLYATEEHLKGNPIVVSGQTASVANRVSHFFDFHGPSLSLDTMCSSSLIAVHLACQAILNGDCEMAIAGGVNTLIHPDKFRAICQSKMASATGRCRSFGKGGDGYVPGEGTGALLLKRKSKAIADGDHIYATVIGTSVNHGGRVSGYMVPNPVAQSEVILSALRKAGISARDVSFIEAHGTGTALGDPLEVTGLTNAFRADTADVGFCRIGSIKSNIGHCESAAGVAAISKVLLQMEHKTLVPSLHAEQENPNLSFAETPFRLQKTLEPWKEPVVEENGVKRIVPRIAGVSAFGAGGANAHILLEAYEDQRPDGEDRPEWIVFSARTEGSLRNILSGFAQFLEEEPGARLCDIARTLMEGREQFEICAAFHADSVSDLAAALRAYLSGDEKRALTDPKEVEKKRNEYVPSGKRISLPGYAFDHMRCWLPQEKDAEPIRRAGAIRLTGQEMYIRDHFVGDRHVLPGSAVLELVRRSAAEQLGQPIRALENILWMLPLQVDGKTDLRLALKDNGDFELRCQAGIVATGRVITGTADMPAVDQRVLSGIENECTREMGGEECYRMFAGVGLESGPSFQVIRQIRSSPASGAAILERAAPEDGCVISPALLNGIFQSVSGVLAFDSGRGQMLPFALGRMEVYTPFPDRCRVYIRREQGTEKMEKFSLLVTDDKRRPVCALDQFTLRATEMPDRECYYTEKWLKAEETKEPRGLKSGDGLMIFAHDPALHAALLEEAISMGVQPADGSGILSEQDPAQMAEAIRQGGKPVSRILCVADAADHQQRMRQGLYFLIRLSRALIALKPQAPVKIAFAYEEGVDEIIPEFAGLDGFAKSIRMENPMLCYQILAVRHSGGKASPGQLAKELLRAFDQSDATMAALRDGMRMERAMVDITDIP